MGIFVWLNENRDWIFSGIGVTIVITIFALIRKKVIGIKGDSYAVIKTNNKRKNICIFIMGDYSNSPLSIDSKKSTPIDFVSWSQKLNSGGDIDLKLEYVNKMNKVLKTKKNSENDRKKIYEAVKHNEKEAEIMKLIIKKALLTKGISSYFLIEGDFPLFVECTTKKCFQSSAYSANYSRVLEVYNGKASFQFTISQGEYKNVLKNSNGKIKIPYYVYFNEFMQYVTDKSIMEREVLPTYLKINAMKEILEEKEIVVENFDYWWISIG